ncbi:SDR family oxidoreductase [Paraburkholderia sp. CNPSo 3274]|uniref:SDR family NAD(P)-dependent oxidoreductase n=1 Tax=Paraburkholderia sp. CNPSo 3274 TaxID=2940932 RepID=UPI0020B7324B|nr:SDR family oxidoreductase [Paraburkholderia sp. CNPSo 3274]MCP3710775.1 SDR family oxidoreductase [Paraburkholderia sp. CNPSo 3274]
MPNNMLEGKVAVVIGSSGGIGKATASWLASSGARRCRNTDLKAAEEIARRLPGEGHMAPLASIADSATLVALAQSVRGRYGKADILMNTAGFTKPVSHADLDALTDELVDEMFKVNWRGQFAALRAFRELLVASGDGLVVNVSSIAVTTGVGSNIAYCAAKAGLDIMGHLARDLIAEGVLNGAGLWTFVTGVKYGSCASPQTLLHARVCCRAGPHGRRSA